MKLDAINNANPTAPAMERPQLRPPAPVRAAADAVAAVAAAQAVDHNELIRQFPSEEILAIARSLDKLQGLLIKRQA